MAILAAMAAPNLQAAMAANRLNGAARQIMSALMEARMNAVSQNNNFFVLFPDSRHYVIFDDDNNNGVADTGEEIIVSDIQNEYYDVTLNKRTNPVFFSRGNAYRTYITVSNSRGTKYVKVAFSGRVAIENAL